MNEQELYHFGIKGMKWGVRRFQNKNGRLTNAGKKRYADDDNKTQLPKKTSKRQLKLEEQYKNLGMSKADAEKQAAKRVKIEKSWLLVPALL